jgi:hypothetical protein
MPDRAQLMRNNWADFAAAQGEAFARLMAFLNFLT